MKAEIIEGKLVIFPETGTELYALKALKKESPNQTVLVNTIEIDAAEYGVR